MEKLTEEREGWHLDKRVPVAMIVAIVAQFAGFIWWAATTDARLGDHSRRIDRMEIGNVESGRALNSLSEKFARVDERMAAQLEILRRIETQLTRQRERIAP